MQNRQNPTQGAATRPAFTLAFCSLMAALGTVLMMSGGLIPILTYCAPLAAGALLIPVMREFGRRWAWMVWFVTSVLSVLLCADREAAFFYVFLGCYPILKIFAERVRPKALSWVVKLVYFAGALALMYGLILFVFQIDIGMEELETLGKLAGILFYLMLVVCMVIYDFALKNLAVIYEFRLRPKLKFLKT